MTLAYMAGICWSSGRWLPRILRRRQDRDLALDPVAARRRMQRQRRWRAVGMTVGVALGCAGLLAGLLLSGRVAL